MTDAIVDLAIRACPQADRGDLRTDPLTLTLLNKVDAERSVSRGTKREGREVCLRRVLAFYAATLVAFLLLDAVWLTYVTAGFFKAQLGDLLRPEPLLSAAFLFYLIYALAITVLAVTPALRLRQGTVALGYGALLGLAAYGAFDLTNLAVLKAWTPELAALDMAWGAVVTALAAGAGYLAGSYLRERDAR